jgi:K+-transporting ATPase ATPase A chain
LPLNSAGLPALSDHLALNTAVSPVTKTNWQLYGGETTMSLFSRMAGMTVHNLVSAATSIALALAVVRSFASTGMAELGNFWADLTCTVLHVCLPICFMTALVFVALGVSQSLQASISATTREGAQQMISIGPVASRRAIKQLGKNRGGFFSANSAYPFENPNAWANLLGIRIWHRV